MSKKRIGEHEEILENIAIDSNVFPNLNFVNYLRINNAEIQVYIPSIVSFEISYYFRHHFRDFVIGTQCENIGFDLVSYNKNQFL